MTGSRGRCIATSRRKPGYLTTIRSERSAGWWTTCCGSCPRASRGCTPGSAGRRSHRSSCDDTREFVKALRALEVTPHVAQHTSNRASGIDGRTTRHPGYLVSQRKRKLVEEIFGWLKTVGLLRKTRHRGERRVDWIFTFAAAVYNLVRIRNLTCQAT